MVKLGNRVNFSRRYFEDILEGFLPALFLKLLPHVRRYPKIVNLIMYN